VSHIVNVEPLTKIASLLGKTAVVKGEDKEGKYEEYVIRQRLPAKDSLQESYIPTNPILS
jgi:hypothetical protein